jgi:hypothetical protein
MGTEPDVSFIFPSNGSMIRCPRPSTGSLGKVPPLRRYNEALRLPTARRASLRCLRSALPPRGGDDRISQVPGEPLCTCPARRTPAESTAPGLRTGCPTSRRLDVVFRVDHHVDLRDVHIFRSSITRPMHALSTLRSAALPRPHARLASGWWPHLGRSGFSPAGFHCEILDYTFILLPTQAYLAQDQACAGT